MPHNRRWMRRLYVCAVVACLNLFAADLMAAGKQIVFLAGRPSHGYGSHEHFAGCALLADALEKAMPGYECTVYKYGWPEDPAALDEADAVVMYCDGGGGHPVLSHLKQIDALSDKGVGIVCLHYGVEVPKGEPGEHFLKWIGGYFETDWSVNPHWTAKFSSFPDHPISNGVKPFEINDEWYYHMRFRPEMEGVTPILSAIPPESTLSRPDGPHSGNPHVRKTVGQPQHVGWASERDNGSRGFGFTGGHNHWNWGDPNFRKVVLNAIVWTAHGEVPERGVTDEPLSFDELKENQDFDPPANFNGEAVRKRLGLTSLPKPPQSTEVAAGKAKSGKPRPKPAYASAVVTTATPGHRVEIRANLEGAKQLFLVAADGGNGFSCDWCDWINPRVLGSEGEVSLTELDWKKATSDWGQVRKNKSAGGQGLQVGGESFETGIGTHANSVIAFDLPEGCTEFRAIAGLDAGGAEQGACGQSASVQFFVYTEDPGSIEDDQRSPEMALAGLDIGDGLEATLFASEPDLKSVTNLDVDARGRVWVCEVMNYRGNQGSRPEGDRILILEDTDGDGVCDKSKVFYQGNDVDSAMGICVLGNRVIVSASPNIIVFTDEDGDDQPDKKELLFTKTGQPQHDHSAHSFLFGPDGKLYWNFGNTGKQVCDADGNVVVDLAGNEVVDNGKPYFGGMPFRCDLDGSNFEVLGHNFRNNYEVTVDSFGTLWQSDNDDDGNRGVRINFVMEFGNYGYRDEMTGAGWSQQRTGWSDEIPLRHWHLNDPGVVPNLLQTGAGSPTGITVYEGALLPEVFRGQVIHCDAGPNVVRAYPTKRSGAGYSAEMVNLMEGTRDKWFRPADVCVASDGSLFVTDWYDPGVGGHAQRDLDRGRIFRIAPPNTAYEPPTYDFSTAAGCVEALKSPAFSVRAIAWLTLQEMGVEAEAEIAKLLESDNLRYRARGYWLLGKIDGLAAKYVARAAAEESSDLRCVAIRLARQTSTDVLGLAGKLAKDESPQVRREVAIAIRHSEAPEAAAIWTELAKQYDGKDRWYLEALGIAADKNWDRFLDAWLKEVGDDWDTPAGRDIVWRSRAKATPKLLVQILSDADLDAKQTDHYMRAFDFLSGPEKDQALESLLLGL